MYVTEYKWAATWQNKQNECAQRRLRSAWASAQSDQSSQSGWRKLGSLATHWAHGKDSGQTGRNAQADLSLRWAHTHFVGFVMPWLKLTVLPLYIFQSFLFCGFLCLSYATAFVISLAFESPMMGLEKVLLGRGKNSWLVVMGIYSYLSLWYRSTSLTPHFNCF